MKNYQSTWEVYSKAWSVADAAERLSLFKLCLSTDCNYSDPIIQTMGYMQLSGYISELHQSIPGVAFVVTDFKSHHDRSLACWNMVDGHGNLLFKGASYGLYDEDGRLIQMTGFFEPPSTN